MYTSSNSASKTDQHVSSLYQRLMKIVYPRWSASETPKHCELVPLC